MLELDGGNWTGGNTKNEEIFEKFYGCYFGKYFHNSDPPISLEQFVQQRVEASLGSDEKVKKREIYPYQPKYLPGSIISLRLLDVPPLSQPPS